MRVTRIKMHIKGEYCYMVTRTRRETTSAGHIPHAPSPDGGHVQVMDADKLVSTVTGTDVTVNIPEGAKLTEIEATLVLAIDGYRRLSDAAEKLKPIIGRILLTIADRRMFRPEFKNFTAYVDSVVVEKMGFGRSNAFDSLKIARSFPSLNDAEYRNYGATRLLLAAQITDEKDPAWRSILDQSTKTTVDKFAEAVRDIKQQTRAITSGAEATVVLSLRVPLSTKEAWDEALKLSALSGPELLLTLVTQWLETPTDAEEPEATSKPVASEGMAESLQRALGKR